MAPAWRDQDGWHVLPWQSKRSATVRMYSHSGVYIKPRAAPYDAPSLTWEAAIIKIVLRVGLTGGLACGKSFVGDVLAQLGCHVLQADRLGHEVLLPGGEAYAPVVKEFGSGILAAAGDIDRRALAAEVFGKPERLALLNSLVHPPVLRREEEWLARAAAQDPQGIAVVEAAILIETGSYRRFDKLIVVTCDMEQQVERSMKRDGTAREEVLARLSRQMPLAGKLKFADFVIDASGTKENTVRQTRAVYESLRGIERP
jgi:dephospho-CoA kinase